MPTSSEVSISEIAIRVEHLGKRYRIRRKRLRYRTLRDTLTGGALRIAREIRSRVTPAEASSDEDWIWALRGVSLEIACGEVVGIIGANGAGKSTFLKILSRITEPTEGEARIRGQVGSLLEVGTGFHPELTGRENVYLNGAILGMKRHEITRKFDEIVEFAEVSRFLDTPVKHYSSGMHLRLAFAVAAHLEPEILLVDEVLAVGDAAFQKKCLGKMDDVARAGRTVLFVSHNMEAVRRLCPRSLLLERGSLAADGKSHEVISRYLRWGDGRPAPETWFDLTRVTRRGSGEVRFQAVRHGSPNERVAHRPYTKGPLDVTIELTSKVSRSFDSMAVSIYTREGTMLINADIAAQGRPVRIKEGRNLVALRIDELFLNPGLYTVGLWLGYTTGGTVDHARAAFEIEVVQDDTDGRGEVPVLEAAVPCRFRFSVLDSDG